MINNVCVSKSLAGATLLAATLLLAGCGGGKEIQQLSYEDRFQQAVKLYEDEEYLDAINEFTVITLQNQGSGFAADAQYYIGECRFKRGEYLLAAFEYQVLRRNYPASPRNAQAQYKVGLCYYNLSPKSSLDQQYTRKAIDELQAYVEYYPADSLVHDADGKITELTERLAGKQYDSATLYVKMDYYRAAMVSFDEVIEKYHDTNFAPLAHKGKVELLMSHKHYREALAEITRFLAKYPNSVLQGQMNDLRKLSQQEIDSGNNVDSTAPKPKPLRPEIPHM